MTWLDQKYISLISHRLERFKRKSGTLFNFRCPLCHDSKRKSNKARGYLYEKENKFLFYCHNCGASMLFENLLKMLDESLYSEFKLERLSEQRTSPDNIWYTKKITFSNDNFALNQLKKLKKISQLPIGHPARDYIEKRQIPSPYHSLFRWCPNFMSWSNLLLPEKYNEEVLCYDEGRILIPYFDQNKKFFAFQGRALLGKQRYLWGILNHETPRIFGLNTVDISKDIFVFEGPIDSCFIPNSIAVGNKFSELIRITTLDKFVIVMDNEPQSIQIKEKIIKAINQGLRVCIWSGMDRWQNKDINEMILDGLDAKNIKNIIETNTFSDLMAKARLAEWSKT